MTPLAMEFVVIVTLVSSFWSTPDWTEEHLWFDRVCSDAGSQRIPLPFTNLSVSFVGNQLSNHRLVCPVVSCRAATSSLHFTWSGSVASLCIIMPQLCYMLLISSSTALHQVVFGWLSFFFPLSVHSCGCFSNVAGVSSEHMTNPFPAFLKKKISPSCP